MDKKKEIINELFKMEIPEILNYFKCVISNVMTDEQINVLYDEVAVINKDKQNKDSKVGNL